MDEDDFASGAIDSDRGRGAPAAPRGRVLEVAADARSIGVVNLAPHARGATAAAGPGDDKSPVRGHGHVGVAAADVAVLVDDLRTDGRAVGRIALGEVPGGKDEVARR